MPEYAHARPQGPGAAPPAVHELVQSAGEPLDEQVQQAAGAKFDRDFSRVRVHADSRADASAFAIGAQAYTVGSHVVFRTDRYRPDTPDGRLLLDHELAHVAQQAQDTAVPSGPLPIAPPDSSAEREANAATGKAASQAELSIQRQPDVDVDVDVEAPSPQEAERLRAAGVQLPDVSAQAADPRTNADYLDRHVTAVYFGLYLGGYLIVCTGLDKPVFVPDTYVDLALRQATPISPSVYPTYGDAFRDIPFGPFASGAAQPFAYYRGAGGAMIVPTVISPATTPRLARMMNEAIHTYAAQGAYALTVLALQIAGAVAGSVVAVRIGSARFARLLKPETRLPRTSELPTELPGNTPQPEPPTSQPDVPGSEAPRAEPEQESAGPTTQQDSPPEPQPTYQPGLPQGLTAEQFAQAGRLLHENTGQFGGEIVVQGSRAAHTARPDSDIDFAIRVSPERFDELMTERFGKPNPGSAWERTMLRARESGKIQAGEAGLRQVRRSLQRQLGMEVDLSIVRVGGPFDTPPFIAVP